MAPATTARARRWLPGRYPVMRAAAADARSRRVCQAGASSSLRDERKRDTSCQMAIVVRAAKQRRDAQRLLSVFSSVYLFVRLACWLAGGGLFLIRGRPECVCLLHFARALAPPTKSVFVLWRRLSAANVEATAAEESIYPCNRRRRPAKVACQTPNRRGASPRKRPSGRLRWRQLQLCSLDCVLSAFGAYCDCLTCAGGR